MSAFKRIIKWCSNCKEKTSHIKEDTVLFCEECEITEETNHGC